ncbi:MAG: deoxynucleoside kinase [Candidatus Beckwithbacteria bacterium]
MEKKKGKLVVRHGPMWSDKTTWLIEQCQINRKTVAFKPNIDNRYTRKAVLKSHSGSEAKAVLVDMNKPKELFYWTDKVKDLERIVIDETNFFNESLIKVVHQFINKGIDVYVAGLLLDSDRKEFGPTKKLTVLADEVIEGRARCDYRYANGVCTRPAKYTYAKAKKESQLVVGAADLYGAACEEHYHLLHVTDKENHEWLKRLRLPKGVKLTGELKEYLKTINLPYFRRSLKFATSRWPRIEVGADTMRVGKTTAVEVLGKELKARGLPVTVSLEDWQHNPYLTKSYKDSSLALLQSQKWFIKKKFEQIAKGAKEAIWIQDVHPEMDFCYALTNAILGRMKLKHFEAYVEYFQRFDWGHLPAPDTLLYLTASDEVILKRANASKRKFEKADNNYFITMKRVNQAWLAGTKYTLDVVILPINTDKFNFAKVEKSKQLLADKVLNKLAELGWRY